MNCKFITLKQCWGMHMVYIYIWSIQFKVRSSSIFFIYNPLCCFPFINPYTWSIYSRYILNIIHIPGVYGLKNKHPSRTKQSGNSNKLSKLSYKLNPGEYRLRVTGWMKELIPYFYGRYFIAHSKNFLFNMGHISKSMLFLILSKLNFHQFSIDLSSFKLNSID